jgi:hypothetical protein
MTSLQRMYQWIGFGALLARFFAAGLAAWLAHRWARSG